jgi:hypothetical protein
LCNRRDRRDADIRRRGAAIGAARTVASAVTISRAAEQLAQRERGVRLAVQRGNFVALVVRAKRRGARTCGKREVSKN